MIASLRGKVKALGADWAIIDVHGIGFRVFLPSSTLSGLGGIGKEVELHTYMHVKEDGITLYGFAGIEELELFQTLLGVSGIGPRLALGILSAMTVEMTSTAIATGNIDLLKTVPGIGKKTAERLVLELKDKISAIPVAASLPGQDGSEVVAVLTSLGYSAAEANQAAARLNAAPGLPLEERVKLALQYLGNR